MSPANGLLDDVRLDVRHAWRTLVRTPGFAAAALSLGLAVGATTAVYSTADWLLGRSASGVVEPERLVSLWQGERGQTDELGRFGFSYPQYLELSRIQDAFVDVAAYAKLVRSFGADGWDDEVVQAYVTGSYFPLLGVRPFLGRLLGPEDDVDGASRLVVLSHSFWQSHFGGDPDVVGTPIRVAAEVGRVVGVLPPEFEGYSLDWGGPTQVWLPMRSAQTTRGMAGMLTMTQTFFRIMGRLPAGVDPAVARERLQRLIPQIPPVTAPRFEAVQIGVTPESRMRISRREQASSFLGGLLAACVLVLLAAFSNVANFLLGRTALRRKEMALRFALGATRARVLRQVLTESSLLAAAAGGTAIALGAGFAFLLAPLPQVYLQVPIWGAPLETGGAIDTSMVGLAVALGSAAAFVAGVLPMLGTFRAPVTALARSDSPWSWSRLRPSPRQCVLVLQIGLAVSLAITATLFARSFRLATAIDPEYRDPEWVLMARLVTIGLDSEEIGRFYGSLLVRLDGAPGVTSFTLSAHRPFAGGWGMVSVPGTDGPLIEVAAATVGARYFETMGIGLTAGRELTWLDGDADAVVINERLANRLWPGEDAVGRTLLLRDEQRRVIGVVDRERCRDPLAEPAPCTWGPVRLAMSSGSGTLTLGVRTVGPARDFVPALRDLVGELSPNVAVVQEQSLEDFLGRFTHAHRAAATASTGLAVFGLILLAVGCASVLSSMVRESVRELAIRMALGATVARVTGRIASQGGLLLVAGAAVGLLAARVAAARLADRLYGIGPADAVSYVIGVALVLAVGMGGVLHAALEATRTAPSEHLHGD